MSKFKIGDRVAAYNSGRRLTGAIDCIGDGLIRLNSDLLWYHPKQCRRLRPARKPREWILIGSYKRGTLYTESGQHVGAEERVFVREVLPPRNKKESE